MNTKPYRKLEPKRVKVNGSHLGIWFGGWSSKPEKASLESLKRRIKKDCKRR